VSSPPSPPPSDAVLRQIDGLRAAVPGCQVTIVLLAPSGDALVIYTPPPHDRARPDVDSPDWLRVDTASLLWIMAPCRETSH